MTRKNYKVIVCEGRDQVGKADAILTFSKKMIELGVPVTYSSFPIYASPFGTIIRLFLRQGLDNFHFEPIRELKIKMAFYALDRLQFMDVLLSNKKSKETLILLDRSPFSNAVSIAYGLANTPKAQDPAVINELVDFAFDLENYMIKTMNLTNCVIQLVSENNSWSNVRNESNDINENEKVQFAADKIYDMYAEKIGSGWRKITTKTGDGWRDRNDIYGDILSFLGERIDTNSLIHRKNMLGIRYEIGIEEILKHMYKGQELPEGVVCKYLNALRTNDKDTMHDSGCLIGTETGKTCKIMKIAHKDVRISMKKITDEIPEIFDVIEYFISKNFVDKFVKAINEK